MIAASQRLMSNRGTKALKVPVAIAVSIVLATLATSCGTSASSSDAADASTDVGMGRDVIADACPDPFACFGDFRMVPDGAVAFCYRRGMTCTDEPCPLPPEGCPIA